MFLEALSTYVASFDAPDNRAGPNVEFIKETFGYREEDIGVEFIPLHCRRAHILLVLTRGMHSRRGSKPCVTLKIVPSSRRRSSPTHWRKR